MKTEQNPAMNPEAREALIARAALGPLSREDAAAWDALVREEPGVTKEMEQMQGMADLLRVLHPAPAADPATLKNLPLPDRVIARLEAARMRGLPTEEVQTISLQEKQKKAGWWETVNAWVSQRLLSLGPLAALGLLVILGIVLLRHEDGSVDGLSHGDSM